MKFVQFLDGELRTLLAQHGYGHSDTNQVLARTSHGYHLHSQLKQEGDRRLGDDPLNALRYYDQALDIFPHNPFTLVNRSIARRTLGDLDGYVQDLSEALLIYPDDPIARFNRSTIYRSAQRWEDALRDLDVAIAVNPDEANFRLARAECFEALDNAAMAVKDYEAALSKVSDPEVSEILRAKLKKLQAGEYR